MVEDAVEVEQPTEVNEDPVKVARTEILGKIKTAFLGFGFTSDKEADMGIIKGFFSCALQREIKSLGRVGLDNLHHVDLCLESLAEGVSGDVEAGSLAIRQIVQNKIPMAQPRVAKTIGERLLVEAGKPKEPDSDAPGDAETDERNDPEDSQGKLDV